MRHYYLFETALKGKTLLCLAPGQIYNIVETGIPLDLMAANLIAQTASKKE